MREPDLIEVFIRPLETVGIDSYMISGSVAAVEYGEPRVTLDVDVAVLLGARQLGLLAEAYGEEEYYLPPEEVIALEVARQSRGHFNVIHLKTGLKADFYPSKNHPLFGWAMRNRRRRGEAGQEVWMAPPEYVILWKLEFFREGGGEKHLRDIERMLAVSSEEIDARLIAETALKMGLTREWNQAQDAST